MNLALTTKLSAMILNAGPKEVRHRDMPNKSMHRKNTHIIDIFLVKV